MTEEEQVIEVKEEKEETPVAEDLPVGTRTRKQGKPKRRTTVFPRKSLVKLVREMCEKYDKKILWTPDALDALILSLEDHLEKKFAVCAGINKLCKRSTLQKDVFEFVETHLNSISS